VAGLFADDALRVDMRNQPLTEVAPASNALAGVRRRVARCYAPLCVTRSVGCTIPAAVVYYVTQRHLVSGLTAGGTTG
jgi:ABC-type glycerol-3-phosphate transport system permease component